MSVKIVEINSDNSDRRLDNFLISKLKNVPKTKIYKIIRKGEVRVNSSRAKPDYKVKKGDLIRIPPNLEISKNTKKSIKPSLIDEFKNNIIYEDKNYLIINKKSGISVHGGTKNFIGIIDILREIHGENIDLCHRLDKYTSGCLVFGKNKQSVRHFNDLLKKRDIKKTYITILKGNLNKKIIVDQPVYKNIKNKVKKSISSFKKIKNLKGCSLVSVQIWTGRTHQIRIHAASINHPIIFDDKYGDKAFNNKLEKKLNKNIALHSQQIEFKDQFSKSISVKCTNPSHMDIFIESLR
jgi:23S rRNA pseudouridine955/2504/2580 synthase